MNKAEIIAYLTRLDNEISAPMHLYLYGSAVVILLDAPDRTSLDIDVAGPYSSGNMAEFEQASRRAGLPVNPDPTFQGNHIEWVGPVRLCLPPPHDKREGLLLWQGEKVTVRSGSAEDLVASKLIRYDETDQADIQYLFAQFSFDWRSVAEAVRRLPHPFKNDSVVLDNLANLETDMRLWKSDL
jgi:hypothetical protein